MQNQSDLARVIKTVGISLLMFWTLLSVVAFIIIGNLTKDPQILLLLFSCGLLIMALVAALVVVIIRS